MLHAEDAAKIVQLHYDVMVDTEVNDIYKLIFRAATRGSYEVDCTDKYWLVKPHDPEYAHRVKMFSELEKQGYIVTKVTRPVSPLSKTTESLGELFEIVAIRIEW